MGVWSLGQSPRAAGHGRRTVAVANFGGESYAPPRMTFRFLYPAGGAAALPPGYSLKSLAVHSQALPDISCRPNGLTPFGNCPTRTNCRWSLSSDIVFDTLAIHSEPQG